MQILNFNMVTGVDTKTNPVLVSDKLLKLENGEVYNARIRKSPGYDSLGNSLITAGTFNQQVFTYANNLYKVQNDTVLGYMESSDSFFTITTLRTLTVFNFTARSNLTNPGTEQTILSSYGQLVCYSLYNTATEYFEIHICDILTNQVFYSDLTFVDSAGFVFDIVSTAGSFIIYFTMDKSVTDVSVSERHISNVTFSLTTYSDIITDLYFFPGWAGVAYAASYYPSLTAQYTNGRIFIMYRVGVETNCSGNLVVRGTYGETSFASSFFFSAMDLTAYQGNTNMGTFAADLSSVPYVLFMFGYNFYLVNSGTNSLHLQFSYTTPTSEIFQTFNVGYDSVTNSLVMLKHNPIQSTTSGVQVCPFVNTYSLTSNSWTLYTNTCNANYNAGQYYNVLGACSLAGGLICINGVYYFAVSIFSYLSGTPENERRATVYLVDSDYNVVQALTSYDSTLYYDGSTYSYVTNVPMSQLDIISESKIGVTYPLYLNQKLFVNSTDVSITYSVVMVSVTSSIPASFFYADYNKSGYFGSSRLVEISGSGVSEQNFFDSPQCTIAASTSTGLLTTTSAYGYGVIYEWNNGEGEVVRSAVSVLKSLTLSGTENTITVSFTPYPFFTTKQNVRTKIYRTIANGPLYFLLTTITDNTTRSFVDTLADSSLQSEILYTSGDVLSDYPFLPSNGFVPHNGLVFSIRQSDPTILDFSKLDQYGVSLAWNPGLYLKGEPRGGAFVALSSIDDKLIAFKQDYIYVVSGSGPDATGSNSTFQGPSLLTSPVGCKYPNTVVRTPVGIMFMSYKGIYLLDRALTIDDNEGYVGADVESYNDYTFTSAALSLRENKVKFTAYTTNTDGSLTGVVLVYDYYYKAWSVETDLLFVSSTTFNGFYTSLLYTGACYQANPAIYLRDGQTYTTVVQTPWAKLATLQSLVTINEVIILGSYVGDHIFQIGVSYDYQDSEVEFMTFNPTQNLGVSNAYGTNAYGTLQVFGGQMTSVFQIRIDLMRTTCMTFRLTFWDKFTSSVYQSGNTFTLTNISVTYAPETEMNTLLQTQIIGSA